MSLYPNLSSGLSSIDLQTEEFNTAPAAIQIMSVPGQVVYDQVTMLDQGMLLKEIQLGEAAADGMYLVKVTINDQGYSAQISFQK